MTHIIKMLDSEIVIPEDATSAVLEHLVNDPRMKVRNKKNYEVPADGDAKFALDALVRRIGFYFSPGYIQGHGNGLILESCGDIDRKGRTALFDAITPYVKPGDFADFYEHSFRNIYRWIYTDTGWKQQKMKLEVSETIPRDFTYEGDSML